MPRSTCFKTNDAAVHSVNRESGSDPVMMSRPGCQAHVRVAVGDSTISGLRGTGAVGRGGGKRAALSKAHTGDAPGRLVAF